MNMIVDPIRMPFIAMSVLTYSAIVMMNAR